MAAKEKVFADGPATLEFEVSVLKRREWVRSTVTIALTAIFAIVLLSPIVALFGAADRVDPILEILQVLLPAITGILGSTLGFYFASND